MGSQAPPQIWAPTCLHLGSQFVSLPLRLGLIVPSSCAILGRAWLRLGRILGPLCFTRASCWPPFGAHRCPNVAPYWHICFLNSPPLRVTKTRVLPYVLGLLLFCTFGSAPMLGPSSLRLHSDLAPLCSQVGSTWAYIGTVFPPPSSYHVFVRAPLLLHHRSDLAPTCLYRAPAWTQEHLIWVCSWPHLAPHSGPILDTFWPHLNPLVAETVRKRYLLLHGLPPLLFTPLGLSWAILGPS